MTLKRNVDAIMARIRRASDGAGRKTPPELIAVTKTVPPSVALELRNLMADPGHLAENRADVFLRKADAFKDATSQARWHFIGHVQRNKARRIIERVDVLHSIDSMRLAQTAARLATEIDRTLEVFVEVNLTGEDEKHGLLPEEVPAVLEALRESSCLSIRGLMAMGPARGLRTTEEVFSEVAQLAAECQSSTPDTFEGGKCLLSMGMSGDLEAAILAGTDYVRVGSALFSDVEITSPTPNLPSR